MQIWSISYTADKNKVKNRCWLQGKMNYSTATSVAHFYDEDNVEIGKIKLRADQIKADAEFTLWKYLIELGVLEEEEECVEDLFERLNKELGIEEFDKKSSEVKTKAAPINVTKKVAMQKPKVPTKVADSEPVNLYDILYTRDLVKKTKTWHDGVMKYHPSLNLAEFHDSTGTLLMKKTMQEVKEGGVVEGAGIVSEICALRNGKENSYDNNDKEQSLQDKPDIYNLVSKSQNNNISSSVLSYSILYTTDKHKKAKKWLDGRLDYDPTSRLAKFIDLEEGNCFYKKVMREGEIVVGEEMQSGLYIIQIDHLIEANNMVVSAPFQPQVKRIKSIVASDSVPLEGRSNEQLLSLLKSRIREVGKDQ